MAGWESQREGESDGQAYTFDGPADTLHPIIFIKVHPLVRGPPHKGRGFVLLNQGFREEFDYDSLRTFVTENQAWKEQGLQETFIPPPQNHWIAETNLKSGKYADQYLSDLMFKSALSWQTSYFDKVTLQERLRANKCEIPEEHWQTIIANPCQDEAEGEPEGVCFVHDSSWAAKFTTRSNYQRYGVVMFFSRKLRPLFLWECGTNIKQDEDLVHKKVGVLIGNPNKKKGEDKVKEYWGGWLKWQEKHDPDTTSYEWLERKKVGAVDVGVPAHESSWKVYDELRAEILEAVTWTQRDWELRHGGQQLTLSEALSAIPTELNLKYQAEALVDREEGPSLACEKYSGEETGRIIENTNSSPHSLVRSDPVPIRTGSDSLCIMN